MSVYMLDIIREIHAREGKTTLELNNEVAFDNAGPIDADMTAWPGPVHPQSRSE